MAHCNAVFFPPIVVASDYFGYVVYHQFCSGVLGLPQDRDQWRDLVNTVMNLRVP
jgi:hypothetical protein